MVSGKEDREGNNDNGRHTVDDQKQSINYGYDLSDLRNRYVNHDVAFPGPTLRKGNAVSLFGLFRTCDHPWQRRKMGICQPFVKFGRLLH
jgi:hypothetical protein